MFLRNAVIAAGNSAGHVDARRAGPGAAAAAGAKTVDEQPPLDRVEPGGDLDLRFMETRR